MVSYWLPPCLFVYPSSLCHLSVFSYPDEYLSKNQWIFTRPGLCIPIVECIHIVEAWFGIATGQISSIFDRVVCLQYLSNLSKYQWIFTKLAMHIDIEDTVQGMKQQFLSNFDRVICLDKKLRGHYCFTFFFFFFQIKSRNQVVQMLLCLHGSR